MMISMRHFTPLLLVTFLIGCSAEPPVQPNTNQDASKIILAIEDDYVDAELNRDEAALRRILAENFVFNSNSGLTIGKEELISSVLGWNMTGQEISERTVVVEGETAVIFGTTELTFTSESGEDTVELLRYTSTYARIGGEWKFLALHMAPRTQAL